MNGSERAGRSCTLRPAKLDSRRHSLLLRFVLLGLALLGESQTLGGGPSKNTAKYLHKKKQRKKKRRRNRLDALLRNRRNTKSLPHNTQRHKIIVSLPSHSPSLFTFPLVSVAAPGFPPFATNNLLVLPLPISLSLTHGTSGLEDMAASGGLSANHPRSSRCSTGSRGHCTDTGGWKARWERGQRSRAKQSDDNQGLKEWASEMFV